MRMSLAKASVLTIKYFVRSLSLSTSMSVKQSLQTSVREYERSTTHREEFVFLAVNKIFIFHIKMSEMFISV